MNRRLLCVWLPDWPIQRLRVQQQAANAERETASRFPIVLWYQDPRRGRLVIARDALAAKLGVRIGMSVAEAGEMASQGSMTPQIQQHDPRSDNEALTTVASMLLDEISPLVAIESLEKAKWAGQGLHQPQSIICDVTGISHLFGGEEGLVNETARLLHDMGYYSKLAIADSLGAAWALAHYHESTDRHPHAIVPIGETREWLNPLPVEALRILPDTVATLARLGVYHIDALLRLPRSGLAPRLGQPLVRRIAEALGETDEPLTVFHPAAEFVSKHELEYATDDRRILEDRIQRLVESVKGRLATSGRGALRLTCRLDLSAHLPFSLEVNLFSPTQDAEHLSRLLISALENKSLPSTVQRLSLAVTLTSPIRSSQQSLFSELQNDWTHSRSAARLIDSLSERLGRQNVLGVVIKKDPLPETSFRTTVLTGRSKPPQFTNARQNHIDDNSGQQPSALLENKQRRPLCLLAKPIKLSVEVASHQTANHPPKVFRHHGRSHTILRHWGPERIETGWWYGPCIRRDYFRVETSLGWWWIYRDLTTQDWMLHGRFS
jgi:protein ImuB